MFSFNILRRQFRASVNLNSFEASQAASANIIGHGIYIRTKAHRECPYEIKIFSGI